MRNVHSELEEYLLPINENATVKESLPKANGEMSDSNCDEVSGDGTIVLRGGSFHEGRRRKNLVQKRACEEKK